MTPQQREESGDGDVAAQEAARPAGEKEARHKAAMFLALDPTASEPMFLGKDLTEALVRGERFLPKLGKHYVHNSDDPAHGYATRGEAVDAAIRYQESCRAFLSSIAERSAASGPLAAESQPHLSQERE